MTDILVGHLGEYKTYIKLSELKSIADKALVEENKKLRDALLAIEYETPALGGRKKDMRTALLQIDCICRSVFEREE